MSERDNTLGYSPCVRTITVRNVENNTVRRWQKVRKEVKHKGYTLGC